MAGVAGVAFALAFLGWACRWHFYQGMERSSAPDIWRKVHVNAGTTAYSKAVGSIDTLLCLYIYESEFQFANATSIHFIIFHPLHHLPSPSSCSLPRLSPLLSLAIISVHLACWHRHRDQRNGHLSSSSSYLSSSSVHLFSSTADLSSSTAHLSSSTAHLSYPPLTSLPPPFISRLRACAFHDRSLRLTMEGAREDEEQRWVGSERGGRAEAQGRRGEGQERHFQAACFRN